MRRALRAGVSRIRPRPAEPPARRRAACRPGRTHERGRAHHARRRLRRARLETRAPRRRFHPGRSDNGRPATERTEVRIAFSDDALYMGVTCFDSEPDKWLGFQRRRDEFLPADDRFMWTIDTFLDAAVRLLLRDEPVGADGRLAAGHGGATTAHGTASGTRACGAARSAGRSRSRFRSARSTSIPNSDDVGHQLPAHRAAQERRQHLDGLGAQPGASAHDQRRPADRHHAT